MASTSSGNGMAYGMNGDGGGGLRRRNVATPSTPPPRTPPRNAASAIRRSMVKNLDMFPKVESDLTEQTHHGGLVTIVGYLLMTVFIMAECLAWRGQNQETVETVVVDTSLGRRIRVDLNISFPGLHCDDLHVDAMDVSGDHQFDIDDTLVKRRLRLDGTPLRGQESKVETNKAHKENEKRKRLQAEGNVTNYCGPCYGAHQDESDCCDTCDDVIEAYKRKRWNHFAVKAVAEQCIREGRDREEPKRMSKGEGCNLAGYMTLNRVAGNFHIAMGEGVEKDGRVVHQFMPDDTPNFNASHIIHKLQFGASSPEFDRRGGAPLNGIRKIVTEETGTTGLFQYFIKVVPTTYWGKELVENFVHPSEDEVLLHKLPEDGAAKDEIGLETNQYFYTERFRPLITELNDENHGMVDHDKLAGATSPGSSDKHDSTTEKHHDHHKIQNAILPGVFFVYDIYPFAIEVRRNSVPASHLWIRAVAAVGGLITIIGWAHGMLSVWQEQEKKRRQQQRGRR